MLKARKGEIDKRNIQCKKRKRGRKWKRTKKIAEKSIKIEKNRVEKRVREA